MTGEGGKEPGADGGTSPSEAGSPGQGMAGNPTAAAGGQSQDAASKPSSGGILSWLVTKPAGMVVSAATLLGALGFLTQFGHDAYVQVRQFAARPAVKSEHVCVDRNTIEFRTTNVGWSSIAIPEAPEVFWSEGGKKEVAVGHVIKAEPPGTEEVKFPKKIEPGQPLHLRLENRMGGFYSIDSEVPPDKRPACSLRIHFKFQNDPPPRRPDTNDKPCDCN
jgi:hypothetical protein